MEIEVTGILLAGGKSRRMGEDKRYLVVGEQTLLERGLSVLHSIFQEVLVVIAKDSDPLGVDARVVRDQVPEWIVYRAHTGDDPLDLRGRMRHAVSQSCGH
jgi:molybdopterin-guanine dinucleotide biosynthesis protein A